MYSARMQELWLRVDMRGFCIGAADRPQCTIHVVVGSVRVCGGQPNIVREGFAGGLRAGVGLFREAALPTTGCG